MINNAQSTIQYVEQRIASIFQEIQKDRNNLKLDELLLAYLNVLVDLSKQTNAV
jgi:hypothetical protein